MSEDRDPDELLKRYKRLLSDIEETQEILRGELSTSLIHHFEREDT